MIATLSDKNRRQLALVILLLLITALFVGIILPLQQSFEEYDTSIEQLEFRLSKLQQIAHQHSSLKTKLKRLQEAVKNSRDLLSGKSAALAGANLQELAKEVLRSTNNRLESSQMLPVKVEEDLQRISIRIQFSATIKTLQQVIYTLEHNRPLLFIEDISIKVIPTRRQAGNRVSKRPAMLNISLDLFGYMQAQEQEE